MSGRARSTAESADATAELVMQKEPLDRDHPVASRGRDQVAVRGHDAIDADLTRKKGDAGPILAQSRDQVDMDKGHLAASLDGPHQRAEVKGRGTKEEDRGDAGREGAGQVLGTPDHGDHGNPLERFEQAAGRSVHGQRPGGRWRRAKSQRNLLCGGSIVRRAACAARHFRTSSLTERRPRSTLRYTKEEGIYS